MPDTADDIFEHLGSFINFEKSQKQTMRDYRLDRMRMLLRHFDNPQDSMRTIHLAGSKGKGSTALYLAAGLSALGEKTGLYSSPHVTTYRERITLAGEFFDDGLIISEGRKILDELPEFTAAKLRGEAEPSAFELLTLLAFLVFRAAGCTVAVIETGIGGRLDATNVIAPIATLITPIEIEHAYLLGDTIALIAAEKAGIIKEGIPVFAAEQRFPEALEVVRTPAAEKHARFYYQPEVLEEFEARLTSSGTELSLKWGSRNNTENTKLPPTLNTTLKMLGHVQAQNAALALTTLRILYDETFAKMPPRVWKELVRRVSAVSLPGRMELIGEYPKIALDGAHTPVSIQHILETFQEVFGDEGICIFGSVEGKNAEAMASLIGPAFHDIIISTPGTFKPSRPEQVWHTFLNYQPETVFFPDPKEALKHAMKKSIGTRPILVTGSFYMVAEIRSLLFPPSTLTNTEET